MIVAGLLIAFRTAANPDPPTPITPEDKEFSLKVEEGEGEGEHKPQPWDDDYWDYYENQYGSFLPIFFALFTAVVGTARMMGIKYFVVREGYKATELVFTSLLI